MDSLKYYCWSILFFLNNVATTLFFASSSLWNLTMNWFSYQTIFFKSYQSLLSLQCLRNNNKVGTRDWFCSYIGSSPLLSFISVNKKITSKMSGSNWNFSEIFCQKISLKQIHIQRIIITCTRISSPSRLTASKSAGRCSFYTTTTTTKTAVEMRPLKTPTSKLFRMYLCVKKHMLSTWIIFGNINIKYHFQARNNFRTNSNDGWNGRTGNLRLFASRDFVKVKLIA